MRKIWRKIAYLIALASGVLTIYLVFSFDHIKRIEFYYSCNNKNSQPVFKFIKDLHENIGKNVFLDFQVDIHCPMAREKKVFKRSVFDDGVLYSFEQCDLADMWKIQCSYPSNTPEDVGERYYSAINHRYGAGGVKYSEYRDIAPANGAQLMVLKNEDGRNAFSSFLIESEDFDIANGPFQVGLINNDGNSRYLVSPSPYSKKLHAEVKCANSWVPLKPLICPFF